MYDVKEATRFVMDEKKKISTLRNPFSHIRGSLFIRTYLSV